MRKPKAFLQVKRTEAVTQVFLAWLGISLSPHKQWKQKMTFKFTADPDTADPKWD